MCTWDTSRVCAEARWRVSEALRPSTCQETLRRTHRTVPMVLEPIVPCSGHSTFDRWPVRSEVLHRAEGITHGDPVWAIVMRDQPVWRALP